MSDRIVRVGVNGYGVISKRIADAVVAQENMDLAGAADFVSDSRNGVDHQMPLL